MHVARLAPVASLSCLPARPAARHARSRRSPVVAAERAFAADAPPSMGIAGSFNKCRFPRPS